MSPWMTLSYKGALSGSAHPAWSALREKTFMSHTKEEQIKRSDQRKRSRL